MIYTEAHARNLIDDDLRSEIIALYDRRNVVIHRFFLEDMTYASLAPLLDRYEVASHHCYDLVNALEERQLVEGTGMTQVGGGDFNHKREIHRLVKMKLGFDPGL